MNKEGLILSVTPLSDISPAASTLNGGQSSGGCGQACGTSSGGGRCGQSTTHSGGRCQVAQTCCAGTMWDTV